MRITILRIGIVASIVVLPFAARAQDEAVGIAPITQSGAFAVCASLNGVGIFGLHGPAVAGFEDGRTIGSAGVKYFLGDRWAGRLVANFGTTTTGPDSAQETGTVVGLAAMVEYHWHDVFAISPYVGAGIGYNQSSEAPTALVEIAQGKTNILATNADQSKLVTTEFGVGVIAGFDWFIASSVAIGSEGTFGFAHEGGTITDKAGKLTDLEPTNSIGIIGSANLHLEIFF